MPRRPTVRLLGLLAAVGLTGGLGWTVAHADAGPPAARDAVAASPATRPSPAPTDASCATLLASYVDRGVPLVGPYGWGGRALPMQLGVRSPTASELDGSTHAAAGAPSTVRVTNEATGTNVQEAGVDEPDTVKTDGHTLFQVQDDRLVTYDVGGTAVVPEGTATLPQGAELLLSGHTLVAVASTEQGLSATPGPQVSVQVLDVTDPSRPRLLHTYDYDASLVAARLIGGSVRLVLATGEPALPFVQPDHRRPEAEATRANQDVVRHSTIEDWLPTVREDGGAPRLAVGCDRVTVPPDADAPLGTVAVVGFAADDPDATSTAGLATGTDLAYVSATHLYLAGTDGAATVGGPLPPPGRQPLAGPLPVPCCGGDGSTHLYAFDLDGIDTTYAASGTVDGAVGSRWAMDEYDGVLRVAVTPTVRTGSFTSILTLHQVGDTLLEVGHLDRIGIGEELESVRWFDQLAIVVTYHQVDPLVAVDLSDPAAPRLLGTLHVPGYSAYLHPLGRHRMLGLGQVQAGGAWAAQAGLFDVTDLDRPARLDAVTYGAGSTALATQDPRQLTWLPDGRTVLTVVERDEPAGRVGYVSELRLGGGRLRNTMTRVEYGDEVGAVRLVPLPDDRVVLVTGDGASFFPLRAGQRG